MNLQHSSFNKSYNYPMEQCAFLQHFTNVVAVLYIILNRSCFENTASNQQCPVLLNVSSLHFLLLVFLRHLVCSHLSLYTSPEFSCLLRAAFHYVNIFSMPPSSTALPHAPVMMGERKRESNISASFKMAKTSRL